MGEIRGRKVATGRDPCRDGEHQGHGTNVKSGQAVVKRKRNSERALKGAPGGYAGRKRRISGKTSSRGKNFFWGRAGPLIDRAATSLP